ncbi:MAG: trimeric intracellular cation channel family protein [Pseudomonadota bacterium]
MYPSLAQQMIFVFDLIGIFVFAISGALAADRKNMDIFGYIVIGLLPAIGGGTLRDLILDAPVFWVEKPIYLWVAVAGGVLTFFAPVRLGRRLKTLIWLDALGLSLFCVLGASKALMITSSITVAITMGLVTAVVGGILRDVVTNEVPLVLQREIYATAAFMGAVTYAFLSLSPVTEPFALLTGGTVAFLIRAAGIHFQLSLPQKR